MRFCPFMAQGYAEDLGIMEGFDTGYQEDDREHSAIVNSPIIQKSIYNLQCVIAGYKRVHRVVTSLGLVVKDERGGDLGSFIHPGRSP